MKKLVQFLSKSLSCTLLLIAANGCEGWVFERAAFGGMVEGQTLRLLVVNRPATFQKLQLLESGFEFEILQQFAMDAGYKLQIKTFSSEREVQRQLARGAGDVAAGRFVPFPQKRSDLLETPAYDEEKTSLVCREGVDPRFSSNGFLDFTNDWKLVVRNHSLESQFVHSMRETAPRLKVQFQDSGSKSHLRTLLSGKADCTLMDRLEAHYYLRALPTLEIVKDISQSRSYVFLVSKSRGELFGQLRNWMIRAAHKKTFLHFKSNFKSRTDALSYFDVRDFLFARQNVLPAMKDSFRKHGQMFNLPWQLAAAVAYQESKWDSEAQSFTGVRGLMQLTQETAEFLGVEDRLDPEQSIWGGIKYLRILLNRQPKGLPFKEKLALALATYNIGPAHMWDAQMLAKKMQKNPYSWKDLKEVLPLLEDAQIASELKYGRARGREPVDFVHRVLAYLELMTIDL